MSWHEHLDAFVQHLRVERGYSPRTIEAYQRDLKEFARIYEAQHGKAPKASLIDNLHIRAHLAELFDKNTHERWVELGKPDVYEKARERVDEILSAPPKNPLPDEVIGKFEDIERRIDGS